VDASVSDELDKVVVMRDPVLSPWNVCKDVGDAMNKPKHRTSDVVVDELENT